jgi:protein-L-isoaspartate O-methyltransferase
VRGPRARGYALGHDEPELARLEHQARLLEPATVAILRLAGISPGMRVLDVGIGLGDVAFAAAELVGSAGAVMGIDQESRVLESVQRRAVSRGLDRLDNVTFEQGDAQRWRLMRKSPQKLAFSRVVTHGAMVPAGELKATPIVFTPGGTIARSGYYGTHLRAIRRTR